jgi:hypothetical protein
MTRTDYITHVKRIEAFIDQGEALSLAIHQHLATDSHKPCITFGSDLLSGYMDMLEVLSGDDTPPISKLHTSWLRYYIWEARGRDDRYGIIHGKKYPVKNASDLWRVLQAWKKLPSL